MTLAQAARDFGLLKSDVERALREYFLLNDDDLFAVVTSYSGLVSPDDFEAAVKELEDEGKVIYGQGAGDCWSLI